MEYATHVVRSELATKEARKKRGLERRIAAHGENKLRKSFAVTRFCRIEERVCSLDDVVWRKKPKTANLIQNCVDLVGVQSLLC